MRLHFIFFLLLQLFVKGFCIFVGNPSDPYMYKQGIFYTAKHKTSWNVKTSIFYDHIYKGRYKDEFKTLQSTPANIDLSTIGALLYFNMKNRIDVFAIFGYSKMQLDKMSYTHSCPSYGGGLSLLLYKKSNLFFTIDGKYFHSNLKSDYFLVNEQVAPIIGDFELQYEEMQGALSLGYKIDSLIPYFALTYLYSTIDPNPPSGLIQRPGTDQLENYASSRALNRKCIGIALGCSLFCKNQMSLNLETRFLDQNAYHISGTFRF